MPLTFLLFTLRITRVHIFISGNAKHQIPVETRSYLPALQANKCVNSRRISVFLAWPPADTDFYTITGWSQLEEVI